MSDNSRRAGEPENDRLPELEGLDEGKAQARREEWMTRQDWSGLRENAIGHWLRQHPAADPEACRSGWMAACDACARFVHGYRRAPWASGEYAVPMRVKDWRALLGWYATDRYEPLLAAPPPLTRALAEWQQMAPGGESDAFAAGWRAACAALAPWAEPEPPFPGTRSIDVWLQLVHLYKTGRYARLTTGVSWPGRSSIPRRVLRGVLCYLATGDHLLAQRVFQGKVTLTLETHPSHEGPSREG